MQLFRSPERRLRSAAFYLASGLAQRDGCLVVATREHREIFIQEIAAFGLQPAELMQQGRLAMCDANQTLAEFMTFNGPNWDRFETAMSAEIAKMGTIGEGGLRAYGEMVGILWSARQYSAALLLEQFWNRLLAKHAFSLYCGYSLDVFDGNNGALDEIVQAHTHLVPANDRRRLESALRRAVDEVFGQDAEALRAEIHHRDAASGAMPNGEALALWLRRNRPAQAREVLQRARALYAPAPTVI